MAKIKTTTLLKRIASGAQVEGAKACAAMAEQLVETGGLDEWTSREARGWIKLGLEYDKASREMSIAEVETLKEQLRAKLERAEKVRQLHAVGAGAED
jgi:hypothetical protein